MTRNRLLSLARVSFEFKQDGDLGGHTDVLKERFVRHMAQMIMAAMARRSQVASAAEETLNQDAGSHPQRQASTSFEGQPVVN